MAFYDSDDAFYGTGQYGAASYGVINPTVSLTGVSATALTRTLHINAFEVDITEPLNVTPALTGSIGSATTTNDSTLTLTGVVGTVQIGTVSPNIAFGITGVSATGAVNTVTDNVTEKLTGVVGTFTVNAAGLSIRSINRVPITGSPMTGTIGTLSPNVDESIATGVEATVSVNTVQVHLSEKLDSISATGSIGTLGISNTVGLTGVVGTTAVEQVQVNGFEIDVLERLESVSATGTIGSPTVNTTAGLTGVVGTLSIGTIELQTLEALESVSATGQIGTIKPNVAESVVGVEGELNPLKPFTASGNAQLSTAEKKFGTASLLLDGTGDFVTTSYTSSLLTNTQWTVDFWVYSSTLTSQTAHLWDGQNSNSGFALRIVNGTLQVIKDNSIIRSVTGQLSNDTWHHIQLQRRSLFTEVFVDGTNRGQQAGAGYNAHTYVIGAKENGSEEFTGHIDEFRASTTARSPLAVSFTPETSAYSLDGSTEALLHFDGANGSTTITNEASNVINLTLTGTANVTLVGVEGVGQIGEVEDQPLERIATGVQATGAIGTVALSNSFTIAGVVGTFSIGTVTATGVIFNFVANDYDRKRVVYVPRQDTVAERRAAA